MPLRRGRLSGYGPRMGRRRRAVCCMSGSTLLRLKPRPADRLSLGHRAYDAGLVQPGLRIDSWRRGMLHVFAQYRDPRVLTMLASERGLASASSCSVIPSARRSHCIPLRCACSQPRQNKDEEQAAGISRSTFVAVSPPVSSGRDLVFPEMLTRLRGDIGV